MIRIDYLKVLFFLLLSIMAAQVNGQIPQLSPAEMRVLESLSPSERRKLIKEYTQNNGRVATPESTPQELDKTVQPLGTRETERRDGLKSERVNEQVGTFDERSFERPRLQEELTPDDVLRREVDRYRNQPNAEIEELQPFGYKLFAGEPQRFEPNGDIPVPDEYIIGPGDTVQLQLYGKQNELYALKVGRNGAIDIPDLGPVNVAGQSFDQMSSQLNTLISQRFIGVNASVTLGDLRSIRVFVLGDVRNPGAYTVSGLSSISNALYVSGGINVSGSLRNVQHKRDGELIGTMDLYSLLLSGDTSNDTRLKSGDVVFIPPRGDTVAVAGEVLRPAIYEIAGETTVWDAISLAGGLRDEAYPRFTSLRRIDRAFERVVDELDLTKAASRQRLVRGGDQIIVGDVQQLRSGYVAIEGSVSRPGLFSWRRGLRVSEVLDGGSGGLADNADLNYAVIVSEINSSRDIRVSSFSPREALSSPRTGADPVLRERDTVLVFNRAGLSQSMEGVNSNAPGVGIDTSAGNAFERADALRDGRSTASEPYSRAVQARYGDRRADAGWPSAKVSPDYRHSPEVGLTGQSGISHRQSLLKPLVKRLREQSNIEERAAVISVEGSVRAPGDYPLGGAATMSVALRAVGGLKPNTDREYSLLVREDPYTQKLRVEQFSIAEILSDASSIVLEPADRLIFFTKDEPREPLLVPLLQRLKEQATLGNMTKVVRIVGEVRFPGEYPAPNTYSMDRLLVAAGGPLPSAYTGTAEIRRRVVGETEASERLILAHSIATIKPTGQRIPILAEDIVHVKRLPNYREVLQVELKGEVVFPGVYSVVRGEKLSNVLKRAGGFTEYAYPEGAVFSRESLKELERERNLEAQQKLEKDIAALEIAQQEGEPQALDQLKTLLQKSRALRPVGRLVIDLAELEQNQKEADIFVEDGDVLTIPSEPASVAVIGEVQLPSSHIFERKLLLDTYIERSGGFSRGADKARVYVIRADGSVWLPRRSRWFSSQKDVINRGDTIVVPLKIDQVNTLNLLSDVGQIVYQLALGAAAVGSL